MSKNKKVVLATKNKKTALAKPLTLLSKQDKNLKAVLDNKANVGNPFNFRFYFGRGLIVPEGLPKE